MSNEKSTGGPAFPTDKEGNLWGSGFGGMTLRDYFAAKAMQSLIDKYPRITVPEDEPPMGPMETKARNLMDSICSGSYAYADAMLKAREQST